MACLQPHVDILLAETLTASVEAIALCKALISWEEYSGALGELAGVISL